MAYHTRFAMSWLWRMYQFCTKMHTQRLMPKANTEYRNFIVKMSNNLQGDTRL